MEFEIVDEIPEPAGNRRTSARKVYEFAKANPGKWVKWPSTFKNSAGASSRASELRGHERYAYMKGKCDIVSRGNNVYVRYIA